MNDSLEERLERCTAAYLKSQDRIHELETDLQRATGFGAWAKDSRTVALMKRCENFEAAWRKATALETEVCTCDRVTQEDQHFPGCPQFNRPARYQSHE